MHCSAWWQASRLTTGAMQEEATSKIAQLSCAFFDVASSCIANVAVLNSMSACKIVHVFGSALVKYKHVWQLSCIAVMALPALHCTHVAVLLFIACQDVDKIHQQLLCIMHSGRKFGGRGNSCIGLTPVPYYPKAMCVNRIKLSTEEHDQHAPVMMQLCVGNSMWHSIWSRLSGWQNKSYGQTNKVYRLWCSVLCADCNPCISQVGIAKVMVLLCGLTGSNLLIWQLDYNSAISTATPQKLIVIICRVQAKSLGLRIQHQRRRPSKSSRDQNKACWVRFVLKTLNGLMGFAQQILPYGNCTWQSVTNKKFYGKKQNSRALHCRSAVLLVLPHWLCYG